MGRPTKYKPEYCEQIIEHMKDGDSLTSFAAKIRIPKATVYRWAEQNPEFRDAIHIAQQLSEAWWEKNLKSITIGGGGNGSASCNQFVMKARFGWKEGSTLEISGPDKGPIEVKNLGNMTDDELRKEMEKHLK